MIVQLSYTWKWGDTSRIQYDTNSPSQMRDLSGAIERNMRTPDIVHQELHEIKRLDLEDYRNVPAW